MSRLQSLKLFVNQRLNAAVEEIFGHFERTIIEYEEEIDRRHRKLLHVVLTREIKLRHADVHQLLESQEEVPPEQQEWSSSLDQEDPEPPHIKEEQEELWTSQEGEQLQGLEEADITKFPFTPVPVKSEDDEEKPQSSQLHQSPTEENREAAPLTSSSTQHMETEADGDGCDTDDRTSDSPGTDVSDEDWIKSTNTRSGVSSVKNKKVSRMQKRFITEKRKTDTVTLSTCSECGKTFCSQSRLNHHKKIHTGLKPFRCNICGKRCTEKGNLKRHFQIHTGEKPFPCTVCGKRFSQKGHMTAHMAAHTGEKPFSCSDCHQRFTWRCQLKRHKCQQ